jgi:uncharacterized protein YydD (DUF2326 family)
MGDFNNSDINGKDPSRYTKDEIFSLIRAWKQLEVEGGRLKNEKQENFYARIHQLSKSTRVKKGFNEKISQLKSSHKFICDWKATRINGSTGREDYFVEYLNDKKYIIQVK